MKIFVNFFAIFFLVIVVNCQTNTNKQKSESKPEIKSGVVNYLTDQAFKEKIFDYVNSKQWSYKGTLPCVIDFYADWCGPCRRVSPILEQLAKDYAGKIMFYKVNTDNEQVLSNSLGITSLPTILLIPANSKPPQAMMGAYPKESYIKAIEDILMAKKQ
jgi:thioredoxin 1